MVLVFHGVAEGGYVGFEGFEGAGAGGFHDADGFFRVCVFDSVGGTGGVV